MRKELNINTVLISIVLALGAWTLKETVGIKGEVSALGARMNNLERVVYK